MITHSKIENHKDSWKVEVHSWGAVGLTHCKMIPVLWFYDYDPRDTQLVGRCPACSEKVPKEVFNLMKALWLKIKLNGEKTVS